MLVVEYVLHIIYKSPSIAIKMLIALFYWLVRLTSDKLVRTVVHLQFPVLVTNGERLYMQLFRLHFKVNNMSLI